MRPAALVIEVLQALCAGRRAVFDIDAATARINRVIGRARTADAACESPAGHRS